MHPHYGADTVARTLDTIADAMLSGCATVDRHGRPYSGSGILVALDPTHERTLPTREAWQTSRMHVETWIRAVAPVVTSRRGGLYFGAWRDSDGTLYLDVAQAFSDAEETEALAAARARGQLAVWHAGRRECIAVADDTRKAA